MGILVYSYYGIFLIMVYSFLWEMQDLYHQPYLLGP